jgi:hypothetical protein
MFFLPGLAYKRRPNLPSALRCMPRDGKVTVDDGSWANGRGDQ